MSLDLVSQAEGHRSRVALVDRTGAHSYGALLDASARVASALLSGAPDLAEARVTFLVQPGFDHVATQWGIWRAGGIAVPLGVSYPAAELARTIQNAEPSHLVVEPETRARIGGGAGAVPLVSPRDLKRAAPGPLPAVDARRRAMMVYTSGTTGTPKGVVTTHANIRAQVATLVEAWEWNAADRILLVLPLHHVHGIINVLTCALSSGACCEVLPRFDAADTWSRLSDESLTLFMAVPTIYRRLISAWDDAPPAQRARLSASCQRLRLMVSGSAALPAALLKRWQELSGHVLLERYGTTETGMVLSNPLHGERRAGSVGTPLPRVDVRLVDDEKRDVPVGTPGEILVRGPGVFVEYWRQPHATAAAFHDGWFVTGDIAVLEDGRYRILGRRSVDIIKTGGYKVSALEIEEVLRNHPAIRDCAVVGVPDPDWGERVCVAAELSAGTDLTLEELREWAADQLAPYKIPRTFEALPSLPRNALGKVTKPDVAARFAGAPLPE